MLGDFSDTRFDYFGVRSRFFRENGKFLVETDGPNGKLGVFEIKYTFGLDPLQQYLVEFLDGRLQALSIAWDSRPKDQGGQRWFQLYPDEQIRHDDFLHWTKPNQNWNFMCAECHSTGVRKNYDAATDRFATSWAEISVGCETCHGRGSRHVAWARDEQRRRSSAQVDDPTKGLVVRFDERTGVTWPLDPATGNALRNATPALLRKEVETCGFCHARRGRFSEDWVPGRWLSDTHVVSPIAHGLYQADGQTRDEVYDYGSFKQSKMFAAGVTCSDCHDPHSGKLRFSGDNTCLQCHSSAVYANARHARHEAANPPLACVSCHMPARTYMVVDRRHDHSLPRSAARPVGEARHIQRLQRLSRRQDGCVVGIRDRALARPEPQGPAHLRGSLSGGMDRRGDRRIAARRHCSEGRHAGDRARKRARPACSASFALEHRLGAGRARRSRSDGADRRTRHAAKRAGDPDLAARLSALVGSQPRRAHPGRVSPRRRSVRAPACG
ncbi:MAG: cytochrome c3 family protein [Rhodoplanes sp.]